ncbi:MAG: T9SS type A sorting domain-containing protein [Rhodothermales bacterium]|nr:T9SS type A sorting domain-containing protein [Rhodothermales bacterium]
MHTSYSVFRATSRALGLSFLLLTLAAPESNAQFAHSLGNESFDSGQGVGIDSSGNVYAAGTFNGTIDFDPGPGEVSYTSTRTDVFVTSYDTTGALRFALPIGNVFATSESSSGIAVEEDGRFYVTGGQPFGSIDFDPDPREFAETVGKVFLAGYTSEGAYRWSAPITGGESSGEGLGISADATGNVYIAGSYVFFLDFAPADTSRGDLPGIGSVDAFFASFTDDGAFRFVGRIGGPGADYARDAVADSEGNVYVTGRVTGTVQFDPDDRDNDGDRGERTTVSTADAFLASYTDEGILRFAYTFGGAFIADDDTGHGVSVDADDNVYVVGEGSGQLSFDPLDADGDGNLEVRAGDGNGSAFLASYTSDGVMRFANVFNGGASAAFDVATNDAGVSYLTGTYSGNTDFDPLNTSLIIDQDGGSDVFVASYDALGDLRKVFTLTGTGLLNGMGIAFEADEDVAITGGYSVLMDLGRGDAVDERTSAGQNDAFIARYPAFEPSSVSSERPPETPRVAGVSSPYPNPFSQATEFDLTLTAPQTLRIRVFDILGREVASIHEGTTPTGTHRIRWSAEGAAPGLYLIRVDGEGVSQTRQVVLLR